MKMKEIRSLGQQLGLKFPVGMTKIEAVRCIQRAEGNFDCFGRAEQAFCDQASCMFHTECLSVSKAQRPPETAAPN